MGARPSGAPTQRSYRMGEALELPASIRMNRVDDPQKSLSDGRVAVTGFHTVFTNMHENDCAVVDADLIRGEGGALYSLQFLACRKV